MLRSSPARLIGPGATPSCTNLLNAPTLQPKYSAACRTLNPRGITFDGRVGVFVTSVSPESKGETKLTVPHLIPEGPSPEIRFRLSGVLPASGWTLALVNLFFDYRAKQ
jgi:hypothetical protein